MFHIKLIPDQYDTAYDSDIILANITKTSLNLPDNSNISDALVSLKTNPASPYKIGDILTTTRTDLGDDWLLCDGTSFDKEVYPDLYYNLNQSPNIEKSNNIVAACNGDIIFEVDSIVIFNKDNISNKYILSINTNFYINDNDNLDSWTKMPWVITGMKDRFLHNYISYIDNQYLIVTVKSDDNKGYSALFTASSLTNTCSRKSYITTGIYGEPGHIVSEVFKIGSRYCVLTRKNTSFCGMSFCYYTTDLNTTEGWSRNKYYPGTDLYFTRPPITLNNVMYSVFLQYTISSGGTRYYGTSIGKYDSSTDTWTIKEITAASSIDYNVPIFFTYINNKFIIYTEDPYLDSGNTIKHRLYVASDFDGVWSMYDISEIITLTSNKPDACYYYNGNYYLAFNNDNHIAYKFSNFSNIANGTQVTIAYNYKEHASWDDRNTRTVYEDNSILEFTTCDPTLKTITFKTASITETPASSNEFTVAAKCYIKAK